MIMTIIINFVYIFDSKIFYLNINTLCRLPFPSPQQDVYRLNILPNLSSIRHIAE